MRTGPARPILLAVVLAPVAFVLGYVGYGAIRGVDLSPADAIYGSLQLFVMEAAVPDGGTPWQLNLARFLAPLSLAYAAVVTAAALLRDQVQRLQVAMFAKEHVVVVGLGAMGYAVATRLRAAELDVVALELRTDNPLVPAARASGVRVVGGDGRSNVGQKAVRTDRARHLIALTGDDSENLAVAATARRVAGESRGTPLALHVGIDDPALWKEFSGLQLSVGDPAVVEDYFNVADRTALMLLNEAERFTEGNFLPWALVDGSSPVATRVVVRLVQRAALAGSRLRVDFTAAGSDCDVLQRLRAEEPWVEGFADLTLVQLDVPKAGDHAPVSLICASGGDAETMSRALQVLRHRPTTQVIAAVNADESDLAAATVSAAGDKLALLHSTLDVVARELLNQSPLEVMAKVRHEHYVAKERAAGRRAGNNPSLVPWDELPESLKESNRRFAESVLTTVAKLGGRIVPLQGPPAAEGLRLDQDTLEQLARQEHVRWMQSLEADGWTYTDGSKDAANKQHPLLVPWEQLDEEERQKDRDAFLAIPEMLAWAGYIIEGPPPSGDY